MRLVNKLSLAFMIGTTAILAGNGYFRVRREVGLFRADRVHDLDLIGRTLGASLQAVWRSEGQARAMGLLEAANAGESRIHFRWDWLDGPGAATDLHVDRGALEALPAGTTTTVIAPDDRGKNERFTYAPLVVDARPGALELSETLDAERAYTRRTVYETMQTTGILALVTALLSYVLGSFFVGRPVRALVEKARRIGRGEFRGPVILSSRDELAEVGDELNATSDALVAANEKVARETAARIATLEQLRHADRLTTVGKLASGVAHELGTPLNVVVARAEMIARGETSSGDAREYANVIVSSAQKMTRIIRQLLEFARRRGPRKERRDLVALTERVLELLRPLAQRQNVELLLDASGGRHGTEADVDAGQIEQVLTNLVVNAVQAMPRGGPVEVSVCRERATPPADHGGAEGEWLAVRVRDRGEGISPDVLPHVFEPFFTTKDVGTGTGLGLSVAHGIASDHGGWIAVESQPIRGSTFIVYLPPRPS
ncbi:MAG TPA: HAMP domain-containing sensor histidine kinase [Polyangiaceae bacterium]|nr:HAMP domain-containing sensor histidine kinase [Polyangiaceae bacterium]